MLSEWDTRKTKPVVNRFKWTLQRSQLMLENSCQLLSSITFSTFTGLLDVGEVSRKTPCRFGRTLIKNSSGAMMQKALAAGAAFITLLIKPVGKTQT